MREQILKISRSLIRSQGFDQVSYRDLSALVGIKTSSIHYYFPSKVDLAVALLQEELDCLKASLSELTGLSPQEKLKVVISIFSQTFEAQSFCLCGILSVRFISNEVSQELRKFFEHLEKFILKCLPESLNSIPHANKEVIAFQTVSLLEGALLVGRSKGITKKEFEESIEAFLSSFF